MCVICRVVVARLSDLIGFSDKPHVVASAAHDKQRILIRAREREGEGERINVNSNV